MKAERIGLTAVLDGIRLRYGLVVAVHAIAVALLVTGYVAWGLAFLIATHAVYLLGTLHPHSRLFGPVVSRSRATERRFWLTIDDGPSADTEEVLSTLRKWNARATFFLVAQRAQAHPALVRRIRAEGHDIGNHTDSHPGPWFWLMGPRSTSRQIEQAQRKLQAVCGCTPRWFRAVNGIANPFVQPVLERLGLRRVSWTRRGYDTVDANLDRVLDRLLAELQPGDILVVHEGAGARLPELLDRLLAATSQKGYRATLPSANLTLDAQSESPGANSAAVGGR